MKSSCVGCKSLVEIWRGRGGATPLNSIISTAVNVKLTHQIAAVLHNACSSYYDYESYKHFTSCLLDSYLTEDIGRTDYRRMTITHYFD